MPRVTLTGPPSSGGLLDLLGLVTATLGRMKAGGRRRRVIRVKVQ